MKNEGSEGTVKKQLVQRTARKECFVAKRLQRLGTPLVPTHFKAYYSDYHERVSRGNIVCIGSDSV